MNRYRYTIQRTILRDGKTQPGVEDTLNVVASSVGEAIDEAKKQETPLAWGWKWVYRVTHIDDYVTEDTEQEEEISYLVGQVLAAARAAETVGGAIGQVLSHDLRSIAETAAREMAKDTRQRYNRNIHEEIGKMIDMYPDHRFGQILVNMGIVEVEERYGEMVANDPFHEEPSVTWSRIKTTTQGNLP